MIAQYMAYVCFPIKPLYYQTLHENEKIKQFTESKDTKMWLK